MRVLAGCLLAAAASMIAAPSSQELRSRYGKPYMEGFIARPDVYVTVEYGGDGLACEARIAPLRSLDFQKFQEADVGKLVPPEVMSQVLEEVAPTGSRGQEINSGSFQSGQCVAGQTNDYENLWIFRGLSVCDPSGQPQVTSALIGFKRQICPKREPPLLLKK
jgi:hypothetical protein